MPKAVIARIAKIASRNLSCCFPLFDIAKVVNENHIA